jgi:hypothetical protein
MHDKSQHVPSYGTAREVDSAIDGAKARFDHADAQHDPDALALIRAAEAMRAKLYGPGGDDPMPVFVIKGTDRIAPAAVEAYHDLCIELGLSDQAGQVWHAAEEIRRWQARHPDRIKKPDHPHVPAA